MGWKDKHYPELQHLMWFLAYMSEKQWLAHVWLALTDLTGEWLTGINRDRLAINAAMHLF
jgi:hypothetical protein